jgi:RNA polymerase sigma-54 factor
MKLGLQLKLGQQLTMTPQLQQAIKLLQMSTLDLQAEIQEALDNNPLLELADDSENDTTISLEFEVANQDALSEKRDIEKTADLNLQVADSSYPTNEEINTHSSTESKTAETESIELDSSNLDLNANEAWSNSQDIPEDFNIDTSWDDIYAESFTSSSSMPDDFSDFTSHKAVEETLQQHLLWQLNLCKLSEIDHEIATTIIDSIDKNGRLTVDLETIRSSLTTPEAIELEEILAVLHRIQLFDPVGVGYRTLKETLTVQLSQIPESTDGLILARRIINEQLDLLGKRDYTTLQHLLSTNEANLKLALLVIRSLNPKPGADFGADNTTYIVPDVLVIKKEGRWVAELNPETAPRLRVNPFYESLANGKSGAVTRESDTTYLRNNLQEARWFIKSLQSRNETLLKVASQIVEKQQDFIELGEIAMRPMILADIAEAVEMHESTISRVTTQKYLHTPRGIFELKYFFSSHVGTEQEGEYSSTAIRALIRQLISSENRASPLSDSKIAQLLAAQGITVARRTIAKYRESLGLAPSNERKQLL